MKTRLPNSVVSWLEKSSSSYNRLLGPVAVFARSEFLHRLTNSIDRILPHLFLIIDYFLLIWLCFWFLSYAKIFIQSTKPAIAKNDCKDTILEGLSIYRASRTMFIVECKSKRLWKYLDGSAIILGPDPQNHPANANNNERRRAISTIDNAKAETWLDEKETYEVEFEKTNRKCFMSVDKAHLASILELSTPKEMFNALDKKYLATNAIPLCQLFCDCQAISIQENVLVMEKYKSMLNLNKEIRVQKPEYAIWDEYLINFLLASIPSTYEGIIDNLNIRDALTLDVVV